MKKLTFLFCFLNFSMSSLAFAQSCGHHDAGSDIDPMGNQTSKLSCEFKLFSNLEKLNRLTGESKFTSILPTELKGLNKGTIILDNEMMNLNPMMLEHEQFLLELKMEEEILKIILNPKMFPEEHHSLIKIELSELEKTAISNETIPAKLFYPIQMPVHSKKNIHVYGLEIGPCKNIE